MASESGMHQGAAPLKDSLTREIEAVKDAQKLYLDLCANLYKKQGYVYQSDIWVDPDNLKEYSYWKHKGSANLQA